MASSSSSSINSPTPHPAAQDVAHENTGENLNVTSSPDSVANFEIEMPDFHLMGEKMSTSVPTNTKSKLIKGKPLEKAKEKTKNVPVSLPMKSKQQQQQQRSKTVTDKDHKLKADVGRPAVTSTAPTPAAQKKTPSDLSLKSMRHTTFRQTSQNDAIASQKVAGDDDNSISDDQHHETAPTKSEGITKLKVDLNYHWKLLFRS